MNMLKIEKDSIKDSLSIQYKKRDSLFTPSFVTALSIALLIHIIPLFLFDISSINLNYPSLILPPITVQIEQSSSNNINANTTSSEIERRRLAKKKALIPPYSTIEFPKIDAYSTDLTIDLPLYKLDDLDHFDQIESSFMVNTENPIAIITTHPEYEVVACGPLCDHLIPINSPNTVSAIHSKIKKERLIFSTDVDKKTGKVIWFEKISGSNNNATLQHASEILKSLHFVFTKKNIISKGVIEITFAKII